MTVHVHRSVGSVGYGDHHHYRSEALAADGGEDDPRTWQFDCTGECEERICKDVEFSGRSAGGVPLTVEEKAEAEHMERAAQKDVNMMAMAMASWAKSQVGQVPAAS